MRRDPSVNGVFPGPPGGTLGDYGAVVRGGCPIRPAALALLSGSTRADRNSGHACGLSDGAGHHGTAPRREADDGSSGFSVSLRMRSPYFSKNMVTSSCSDELVTIWRPLTSSATSSPNPARDATRRAVCVS
jgi:hypothetical protein